MARSHGIEFQKMYLLRFTSVARGHHVYKKIWKPVIGETLVCQHHTRGEAKQYNEFAVGIYLVDNQGNGQKLVGHVPIKLSFLLCKFLTRDSCILKFSPAGARMLEDGLVVRGTFSAFCKSRTMNNILKTELEKKVVKLAYMKIDVGDVEFKNAVTYPISE